MTLVYSTTGAAPLKVAVIDTGLDLSDKRFAGRICEGSKDFTGNGIKDVLGHGTHVAGTILKYAGKRKDFCLLILKFYDAAADGMVNVRHTVEALRYAAEQRANIVNYSAGGPEAFEDERVAIQSMPWATVIAAAGNDSKDVRAGRYPLSSNTEGYYPAAYGLVNVIPVGSVSAAGDRMSTSNFGPGVLVWELGEVVSTLPNGKTGMMRGTSQAAAVVTGKVVGGTAAKSLMRLLRR